MSHHKKSEQPPIPDNSASIPPDDAPAKDAYAGRPDQDVTRNTGAGAGGATEYGGGNKNHPSRINSRPPGNS
jgi:hypothetical protein